jgi:hypothetical protein
MSNDGWIEVLKTLAVAGPIWIILGILAIRSPQLVKEFFAGLASLLKLWLGQKRNQKKTDH